MLKFLNVNRSMTIVWSIYVHCFSGIFSVAVMFLLIVLAFAQFGNLSFGGVERGFVTMTTST